MYKACGAAIDFVPRAHRQCKASAESVLSWNYETWNAISWNTSAGNVLNPNYLRQLCNDWGEYIDRAADWTGYPGQSSVVGVYEIIQTHDALSWPLPGGGSYRYALPNRHAILCAEMPKALMEIHQAVIRLDADLRGAFTFWYAYSLNSQGALWDRHDKAKFVGLSYEAFKERVQRAREKVAETIEKSIELAYLG